MKSHETVADRMPDDVKASHSTAEQYMPHVKAHLGRLLFTAAPIDMDLKRNTDLIMLRAENKNIAVRIRAHTYWNSYPQDITFRKDRPSGVAVELDKLLNGHGDLFFYGFGAPVPPALLGWIVVDLHELRKQALFSSFGMAARISFKDCVNNTADRSGFVAVDTCSLLPECIVGASTNHPWYARVAA